VRGIDLKIDDIWVLDLSMTGWAKQRARHTNDNALAESKNASIVRKYLGYSHIPQKWRR
jgi:hypothetical protein